MKTDRINLAANISWRRLLTACAIEPDSSALPCTIRCPVCSQQTLTLYNDTVNGGQWHFCHECQTCGDNVQLLAKFEHIPVDEAYYRAVNQDLCDTVVAASTNYLNEWQSSYHARRSETDQFWKDCSAFFPVADQEVNPVRHQLGIRSMFAWSARGGRFLGAVERHKLVNYLRKNKTPFGANWSQCVVIPLYDLPGRISSFMLLLQRRHEDHLTTAFISANLDKVVATGAAMLDGLFARHSQLGNTLFVVTDILACCRMYLKHFESNTNILPVIAVDPAIEPPPIVYIVGNQRKSVVWGRKLTREVLSTAKLLDAGVTWPTPNTKERALPESTEKFSGWLDFIDKSSRSWQTALDRHLSFCTLADAESTLSQIGYTGDKLVQFLKVCDPDVSKRLAILVNVVKHREVMIDGNTVIEDSRGWTLVGGTVVSDVILTIDHVITRQASRTTGATKLWYQGRFIYKGQEVHFTADQADFEKHPFKYAAGKIIEAGLGVPVFKERWRTRALELALLFHKPNVSTIAAVYGWDNNQQRFVLPACIIHRGGAVSDNTQPRLDLPLVAATKLGKPLEMTTDQLDQLCEATVATAVWSTLGAVLYNILAPVYGYRNVGTMLIRSGDSVMQVAEAAGCPLLPHIRPHSKKINRILDAERKNTWPVVVSDSVGPVDQWKPLLDASPNVIIPANELQAAVSIFNGGWHGLFNASNPISAATANLVGLMVTDFLRHLCYNNFSGGLWSQDPASRLKEELYNYIGQRGGDVFTVSTSMDNWLTVATATMFGGILVRLHDDGCLPLNDNTRPVATVRSGNNGKELLISKQAINEILRGEQVTPLDLSRVSTILAQEEVLLGEEHHNHGTAWVLPYAWWERQLFTHRVPERRKFKLIN